jgi:hypothetical protein
VSRVFVRTAPDGEQHFMAMQPAGAASRWWAAELPLEMPSTHYRFLLHTPEGGWWLSAAGLMRHNPTDATDFKLLAGYTGPEWLRDAVFYQIFPDRFADGDPTNNPRDGELLADGRPAVARKWGQRLIVVARRADDGLTTLPVRSAGLPDGMRLREYLSGREATVQHGLLPLDGLAPVGAQVWVEIR